MNSFGYGGANSHVILDDAFNYMKLRDLDGKHATSPLPPETTSIEKSSKHLASSAPAVNGCGHHGAAPTAPKLLVWSAADKNGIGRMTEALQGWFESLDPAQASNPDLLANLAFTLDSHRSRLSWRSFALLNTAEDLQTLPVLTPTKAKVDPARTGFVFSGQGAQWYAMGRELLCYPSFKEDFDRAADVLNSLGCPWSPIGKMTLPGCTGRAKLKLTLWQSNYPSQSKNQMSTSPNSARRFAQSCSSLWSTSCATSTFSPPPLLAILPERLRLRKHLHYTWRFCSLQ